MKVMLCHPPTIV